MSDSSLESSSQAPSASLEELRKSVDQDPKLSEKIRPFSSGETILAENQESRRLMLILEGKMRLTKPGPDGDLLRLDHLGPGEWVGILAFHARESSFFGVEATSDGTVLELSWEEFESLQSSRSDIFDQLQAFIRQSFFNRYRRLVALHLQLQQTHGELQTERRHLRDTIAELERTRHRLVQREKLALMGSIVPGIAHELNNPAASLARNADYLETLLREAFACDPDQKWLREFWDAGLRAALPDSRRVRERMEALEMAFPGFDRGFLRRIAALPAEFDEIVNESGAGEESFWEVRLRAFELARFLYIVRNASGRISRLVRSLRRYARPPRDEMSPIPVQQGIQDTLLILGSMLRDIEVETRFSGELRINGNEHELNQVWTNLIVNAVEAMNGKGILKISVDPVEGHHVDVHIADNGPGIPEDRRKTVFDPNFTTKSEGGGFGLGLGLSIVQSIIENHGGEVRIVDGIDGGACFVVRLPTPV